VTRLRGEHVALEPLDIVHAAELWPAADDDVIREWWPRRWHSREDVEAQFRHLCKRRDEGTAEPFLIRALADAGRDPAAGATAFYGISDEHRHLSIGWTFLLAPYRRSAVNTETKLLLLEEAFERRGLARVQFDVDSRNLRSQTAVARIGARREGVLRKHRVLWNGYLRDTVVFSVTADEWPDVKARLRARRAAGAAGTTE
jgi:RimJ/RimL family protein N-acetyltransferase